MPRGRAERYALFLLFVLYSVVLDAECLNVCICSWQLHSCFDWISCLSVWSNSVMFDASSVQNSSLCCCNPSISQLFSSLIHSNFYVVLPNWPSIARWQRPGAPPSRRITMREHMSSSPMNSPPHHDMLIIDADRAPSGRNRHTSGRRHSHARLEEEVTMKLCRISSA